MDSFNHVYIHTYIHTYIYVYVFLGGPDDSDENNSTPNSRRGSQNNYVRQLWKRAIMDQVISIRAKKLTDNVGGDRTKADKKKLGYEELILYNVEEKTKLWKLLLNSIDRQTNCIDSFKLKEMIKTGSYFCYSKCPKKLICSFISSNPYLET